MTSSPAVPLPLISLPAPAAGPPIVRPVAEPPATAKVIPAASLSEIVLPWIVVPV